MLSLWDFYSGTFHPPGADSQYDVDAYYTATHARKEAEKAARTVQNMEKTIDEKIDRLALICRAMWELLRESNNISEESLLKKINEVDLLDGSLDGKVRTPPKKCSKCGRTVSKRHMRCIYCGSQELFDSAFDTM